MDYIFEITDKTRRNIYLRREEWVHITSPQSLHPQMASYLEEIKQTLIKPDLIVPNKYDDKRANYYKLLKERKLYVLVIVKYLNGEGYIISSFLTRKIIRR